MGKIDNIFYEIIVLVAGISLDLALKILDFFIIIAGAGLLGITYGLLKWSRS